MAPLEPADGGCRPTPEDPVSTHVQQPLHTSYVGTDRDDAQDAGVLAVPRRRGRGGARRRDR
jgi:hypothetical protein